MELLLGVIAIGGIFAIKKYLIKDDKVDEVTDDDENDNLDLVFMEKHLDIK